MAYPLGVVKKIKTMKKIYLCLFTLGCMMASNQLQAQTQKGWYIIGGNLANIDFGFQKNNTNFSLDLTPRVAWFVQDNLALGVQLLAGVSTTKTNSTSSTNVRYGISPIARYYFTGKAIESVRKTRWFGDVNIGIQGENSKISSQPTVTTNGLGIGFGPGIAYFINQNIALEVLAKYNIIVGFGSSTTSNNVSLGVGFQIHLPGSKLKAMKSDVNTN